MLKDEGHAARGSLSGTRPIHGAHRQSAVLRRLRHAGRLARRRRARGRAHPRAARPSRSTGPPSPMRGATNTSRRWRRCAPAASRSAGSTCCTGATSTASCRASASPAHATTPLRDLNLAWHRLDAWPEVSPALARLRGASARAGLQRQHLADGRPRAAQRRCPGTRSSAPRSRATTSRSREVYRRRLRGLRPAARMPA